MGAWKSTDGGSISVLGVSRANVGPGAGDTDIVSVAANVRGCILRTATIQAASGNVGGTVKAGGVNLFGLTNSGTGSDNFASLPAEIFIPAGNALTVHVIAGAPNFQLSYDLL